jgi:ribosomal protein S19E (S16A)
MVLPYGILEQYSYFVTFLDGTTPNLHIQEPFYETASILDIAIKDWETKHGSDQVRIQYYESDSCTKRVLTKKGSGLIKRIVLEKVYTSGWVWKSSREFVTSVRLK